MGGGGELSEQRAGDERSYPFMQQMPLSLFTFIHFIQLKSIRQRTQDSYLSWIRRIAAHTGVACPSLLTQEEVLTFIHFLQQIKGYEGSTLNQAVCALRLFFRDHLGKTDWTCWSASTSNGSRLYRWS